MVTALRPSASHGRSRAADPCRGTVVDVNRLGEQTRLRLWRFVRGDDPARAFEAWAYRERLLEAQLGEDLHMKIASTNFGDRHAVWSLRERLGQILRAEPDAECFCVRLRDRETVGMGTYDPPSPAFEEDRDWSGEEVLRTLDVVHKAPKPRWWLAVVTCSACGQAWLMAQESRHNDIYILQRLDAGERREIEDNERWPSGFERYEQLLAIGRAQGHSVGYVDPLGSTELQATMADVARERPGVRLSELAELLGLDHELALVLARHVVADEDVTIRFDLS